MRIRPRWRCSHRAWWWRCLRGGWTYEETLAQAHDAARDHALASQHFVIVESVVDGLP